ncbi:MAG: retroviral-like aspartic protease [bacterium]|nr:retroviral-like aspartic protease [bacterium]
MINTYRYGGYKSYNNEEETQKTEVPPCDILEIKGPFLPVTVTHPRIIQEDLRRKGQEVSSLSINALIDTGASFTAISSKIANNLNLMHTGYQKVLSIHDEQEQPVYYGFIIFPWGNGKEIPIVCCPLKEIDCLIGRDILKHWLFTYNGIDGSITICD